MWVTSRWIMDRLKYFYSEFNTQGRRREMMMLRRWAFREYWSTCPIVFKFYTQHLQGLFGVYELWPTFGSELWPILTFWRTIRFRSRSRKVLGRLLSYYTYMFSKIPSCVFSVFLTLTLKLTQHFDLIYDIGKSDWNILRNIMKTAKDGYTITIK